MEVLEIKRTARQLDVNEAMLQNSSITTSCLNGTVFNDIAAINVKITDANLSDIEIASAQLGGAYIHNIGMPPKGHPHYDANAKQRPLKFENCDLNGSEILICDLSGVSISQCNISGMKINGVLVTDLFTAYEEK
ncbi:pentapeptide repeat-containing protein [Inquilinus sp. KBS0705]|nr:pentapeptide repeat-containing protein [Inquilinus sp. KBS0705]